MMMSSFFDEVIDKNFPADNDFEIMTVFIALQVKLNFLKYSQGMFDIYLRYFEDTAKRNHIMLPYVDPLLRKGVDNELIQFLEIFKVYAHQLCILKKHQIKKTLEIERYFANDKSLFEGYFKDLMARIFNYLC